MFAADHGGDPAPITPSNRERQQHDGAIGGVPKHGDARLEWFMSGKGFDPS
jgi:hypothetical protein